jgi:flagellar protein FliO/FliZ
MRVFTFIIALLFFYSAAGFAQDGNTQNKVAQKEVAQSENKVNTSADVKQVVVQQAVKENIAVKKNIEQATKTTNELEIPSEPVVGRHVGANMDATSMIVSLLMVLVVIIISAFVLKRFQLVQQGGGQLKVVANLSLGAKERIIVVQVGEQQLLLGVSAQQVTLLDKLDEPLSQQNKSQHNKENSAQLPSSVLSFLKKSR